MLEMMEMKADTSNVLMSDVLKGQIPELDDSTVEAIAREGEKYVTVVAERVIGSGTDAMIGVLRGILLGSDPEIEFRCDLSEALVLLKATNLSFNKFELHHGAEDIVTIPGPFIVKAARVDEISPRDQMCTLGLHLARSAR